MTAIDQIDGFQSSKVIKETNPQLKKYKISKKQTPVKKDIKNKIGIQPIHYY